MSKWQEDGASAPNYIEAHVRLEAASAEKNVLRGHRAAVWSDQFGQNCGTVTFENFDEYQCVIRYNLFDPWSSAVAQGRQVLGIERVDTNPLYRKPYFLCPLCAARAGQMLFAKERWACRSCQGLHHRSKRLSPLARAWARLDELTQLLKPQLYQGARPRFMREARFTALLREYEALRAELVGKSRTRPHQGLSYVLSASWEAAPH